MTKSIVYLMLVIQPWPPEDFGMLADSLVAIQAATFSSGNAGMNKDVFTMFSKTIFGNDVLNDANLTLKVI
jgi:hypothetical protein